MRTLSLTISFVLAAAAARAQSPYVAGTIGADVSRLSRTESNVSSASSADNEVLSGSIRVGTSVGQNWGVELEFVKSGHARGGVVPVSPYLANNVADRVSLGPAGTAMFSFAALPVNFQTDVRQSHFDFDSVAWVRQRVGSNVDLVYLGGVAFSHQRVEITQTFPTALGALLPIPGGSFRTAIVDYSTRPLVGAEARIGLTSHVRLIPGLRLQGLADGWLLRPYVGLGWFF